jgi:hypothetical protein
MKNVSNIENWQALHCLNRIAMRSSRYAIGVIVVGMILALPEMSAANETE